jgi:hypothetical protein
MLICIFKYYEFFIFQTDDVNLVRLPTYADSNNTFTGIEAIASGFGKTSDSREFQT